MEAECRAYDAALADGGGIDLCVLGLGGNGHVAFNEPGSPWDLGTHVVHCRLPRAPLTSAKRKPPGESPPGA